MARRGFLVIAVMLFAVVFFTNACIAQSDSGSAEPSAKCRKAGICNDGAWKKLGRGACNMLTFSFEMFNQISKTNDSDGPMAAFTWGLLKGVGMSAFRALVGVYEVVSFPMPYPEDYKPILTDPEFFFEGQIA